MVPGDTLYVRGLPPAEAGLVVYGFLADPFSDTGSSAPDKVAFMGTLDEEGFAKLRFSSGLKTGRNTTAVYHLLITGGTASRRYTGQVTLTGGAACISWKDLARLR